jgi:transglutaminase-like putative cysteine protease
MAATTTATTTRPPATAPARPSARSLLPAAEGLLVVVSLATVLGMWRLFEDGSFFWPLTGHAVAAHLVAAACRRRGLSLPVSALVTAVAAVLVLTWSHLGATTALGLPTTATIEAARDRLDEAWRMFDEVKAPAPVLPGFLLAAGAALWAGAWLADLAAFRLWTSFEALIPSGTVFVFASLFTAEKGRAAAAAGWLAAALGFVLVHRTVRQHASPSWLGSDPRLGTAALLKAGAGLVALAVLGAVVIGPRLPGAGEAAIVAVRDLDDGGGSRQTVSPLVEIRGRLIEQSQAELFTVRSTQRAYWRLTSLDEFDGEVWSSRGSFGGADGELDDIGEPPPASVAVTQQFRISGLAAIWLPAAFDPMAVDPGDAEVRWEAESSTLIVSTDLPTSDGLEYQVISQVPTGVTPEDLGAPTPTPEQLGEVGNLDLPPGFPGPVVDLARQVVADAGATTPYGIAMALQSFFLSGAFTYSLDVPPGHSDSAIEDFLFVSRAGYCEQFAGTYAAMARAVGLPARVAVGFTPGIADAADPQLYRVRGEHAHAWPEVWIPEAGWIAFEPTPGRGAPNAAYTGLPEAQDTPGESVEPMIVPTTIQEAVPTTLPGATTTTPTPLTDVTEPDPLTPGEGNASSPLLRWIVWAVLAVLAAGVLAVVGGAGIAGFRALRRWRRRASASTPDAKVRAAWADTVEAVGIVGVVPRRHETPVEYARRASKAVGDTRPTPLAWVVEQADYAADAVGDDEAATAVELADGIRASVRERTTARTRVLAAADPRPPERRGAARGPRPAGPRIQIRRDAGVGSG